MPRLARRVVIDRALRTITVDGEAFPWHVAPEVSVDVELPRGPSVVHLAILVDGDVAIIGEDDSVGDARDAPRLRKGGGPP